MIQAALDITNRSLSPGHPHRQPESEAPEGARLVAPGPEDGEEEDGADGRGEVRGDGLDVVKEAGSLSGANHRDPGHGGGRQAGGEGAAGYEKFALARPPTAESKEKNDSRNEHGGS